jgi:serine/threonine protein kinase
MSYYGEMKQLQGIEFDPKQRLGRGGFGSVFCKIFSITTYYKIFSSLLSGIQPISASEIIQQILGNNPENRISSNEVVLQLKTLKKEVTTRQFNNHWNFFISKILVDLFVNLYLTWDLIIDGNQIIQIIGSIKCRLRRSQSSDRRRCRCQLR